MYLLGVYLADVFRVFGFLCMGIVMIFFPRAIRVWMRPRRTWDLVIGCELIILGGVGIMYARWGHSLVFYASPLIVIGSFFLAMYVTRAIWLDKDSERAHREALRSRQQS